MFEVKKKMVVSRRFLGLVMISLVAPVCGLLLMYLLGYWRDSEFFLRHFGLPLTLGQVFAISLLVPLVHVAVVRWLDAGLAAHIMRSIGVCALLVMAVWLVQYFMVSQPTFSPVKFSEWNLTPSMGYAYGLSVDDYDGNGKPDITFGNSWVSSRAQGNGASLEILWDAKNKDVLVSGERFDFAPSPVQDRFLLEIHVPLDIDGDGLKDIVAVANSHDAVVAYINPGRRGTPWVRRVISSQTPGVVNISPADIDHDGDSDLFVTMRRQAQSFPETRQGIVWLENAGKSEWALHVIDDSEYFGGTRTVQSGDLDRDGLLDVLVSDARMNRLAWYGRAHNGHWSRHVIEGLDVRFAHYGKLQDMNRDGLLDIVMPHRGGVSWLENVDNGSHWRIHPVVRFPTVGNQRDQTITEVAVADFDGDGRDDVAFSTAYFTFSPQGALYWARNLGDDWSLHVIKSAWARATNIQAADVNGDGLPDIVAVGEYDSQVVTLWLNQGPRRLLRHD